MPDMGAALQLVVDGLLTGPAGLAAAGMTASTDPASVVGPGVLVQLVSFQKDTLGGGWLYDVNLVLVVPDVDGGPGPAAALTQLLNMILAWAQPDGPIQARSVQLPSGPAPLPGLVFPLQVRTDA